MFTKKTKRYLMLLAALGIIAIAAGGGAGTFAGFNATVANQGNVFATGTLFLHGQKQSGNICRSEANASNTNTTCEVLIDSSANGGGDTAFANIKLTNAGSLNATGLTLTTTCDDTGVPVIATADTYSSGTYTSVSPLTLTNVAGLTQPLAEGTVLELTDGTHTDDLTVLNDTASGATSFDVSGTSAAGMTSTAQIHLKTSFAAGALCDSTNGVQFYVQERNTGWAADEECLLPSTGTSCAFTDTLGTSVTNSPNDLTTNLWTGAGAGAVLDAGKSRYLRIGVKMPTSAGAQNAQAKFDLTWQISQ